MTGFHPRPEALGISTPESISKQSVKVRDAFFGEPVGLVVGAHADRADVVVADELVLRGAVEFRAVLEEGSSPQPEQHGQRVRR